MHSQASHADASMTSSQLGDHDVELANLSDASNDNASGRDVNREAAADTQNIPIKELLNRKKKRRGMKLMPSTVKRLQERKKRRRASRSQGEQSEATQNSNGVSDGYANSLGTNPVEGYDNNRDNNAASQQEPSNQQETQNAQPHLNGSAETGSTPNKNNSNSNSPRENTIINDVEEGDVVAPQVTIDENGNIVIDQASLFVDANTAPDDSDQIVNTVEHHPLGNPISSASFAKREKSIKWTNAETERFYQALRTFGTDFTLMLSQFPKRSRRQLKYKFKREEREHSTRIEEALNGPRLPMPSSLQNELDEAWLQASETIVRSSKQSTSMGKEATLPSINLAKLNPEAAIPTSPFLDEGNDGPVGREEIDNPDGEEETHIANRTDGTHDEIVGRVSDDEEEVVYDYEPAEDDDDNDDVKDVDADFNDDFSDDE